MHTLSSKIAICGTWSLTLHKNCHLDDFMLAIKRCEGRHRRSWQPSFHNPHRKWLAQTNLPYKDQKDLVVKQVLSGHTKVRHCTVLVMATNRWHCTVSQRYESCWIVFLFSVDRTAISFSSQSPALWGRWWCFTIATRPHLCTANSKVKLSKEKKKRQHRQSRIHWNADQWNFLFTSLSFKFLV